MLAAMPMAQPYKPPLPHPAKVVPKVVLIIAAILVFVHLFWNLGSDARSVPHPVRVSLLNADVHEQKGLSGAESLRSGLALISPLEAARTPRAVRFEQPMGSPLAALTYNAREFQEEYHLGDDLNGIGGGNSDLGDPIFSAADGQVVYAANSSEGWGNVIVVQHRRDNKELFQTLYAHLDTMHVSVGEQVVRGQQLGTVGTANGNYLAHLHLELRESQSLDVGSGYAPFTMGRLPAEDRLNEIRGASEQLQNPSFAQVKKDLGKVPEVELKGSASSLERFKIEVEE